MMNQTVKSEDEDHVIGTPSDSDHGELPYSGRGARKKLESKFSMGDVQFLIDKGVMKQDNAEFQKFKRENITTWGAIS